MRYIGDISRRDADLLCRYARPAERIVEFGSGASTQVLAQCCAPSATIVSVETDPSWIARTRDNLGRFGIEKPVRFLPFKRWADALASEARFDLIFNDGIDKYRRKFAIDSWPFLKVGGHLLVHDTRRKKDLENVLHLLEKVYLEVEAVFLNEASSNITVLKKKIAEPWEDWNVVEGRQRWEYGHAEPPGKP